MSNDLEKHENNKDSYPSLTHSDSGEGPSQTSSEFNSYNFSLREHPNILESLGPLQDTDNLVSPNDPDSGLEMTPKDFTFSPPYCFTTEKLDNAAKGDRPQHSSAAVSVSNELKVNFEGPVSIVTNGGNKQNEENANKKSHYLYTGQEHSHDKQSMKSSNKGQLPMLQKQCSIGCPYLTMSSFDKDESLKSKYLNDKVSILLPNFSIPSDTGNYEHSGQSFRSSEINQNNLQTNNNLQKMPPPNDHIYLNRTVPQNLAMQNGKDQQNLPVFKHTKSVQNDLFCHADIPMSPQSFMSKDIVENLVRELTMIKKKLETSQIKYNHLYCETKGKEQVIEDMQGQLDRQRQQLESKQDEIDDLKKHCEMLESKVNNLTEANKWITEGRESELARKDLEDFNIRIQSAASDETNVKRL